MMVRTTPHPRGARLLRCRVPLSPAIALAVLLTAAYQLLGGGSGVPQHTGAADEWRPRHAAPLLKTRTAGGVREAFATLFALEMQSELGLRKDGALPPPDARHSLEELVPRLRSQGVGILFISVKWFDQQPSPRTFQFRIMDYVQQAVCSRGLRLAVVLDAQANPRWVVERRYPEAKVEDSWGNRKPTASFNHAEAMQLVYAWHDAVLARLAANNASCVHSVQPSWNNEYETKYGQEGDGAQDYSKSALQLFSHLLHSVHGDLAHWNARWGTAFEDWAAVAPTKIFQHGLHWGNTARDVLYWDWQHFRHHRIHLVHEAACQHIAQHGFRCIMHFAEFMTGSDAIYAAGSVFTLAASPWLDYIVVDSNFMTTAMLPAQDVRVVQVLLSAMKPFGKPVFFEGAFERISDPAVHRKAVQLTATSGAHGVGFTNWLDRVGPTFFNDTLSGLPIPRSDAPAVAILSPWRSYSAFKGAPKDAEGVLYPTDPQQDRLFACLDEVERVVPSLDGLHIFGVPTMLLPLLQSFEQVWYLEPDVLLSGDANTVARIKQQAAELGVPLHDCVKRAVPAVVVSECCPTM